MLQNDVYLEPVSHRYFHRGTGKELISWSRFIENFFPKFDKQAISRACAGRGKYVGMSQDEVLNAWAGKAKTAADHGTRIHDALEYFGKNFKMKAGAEDLQPLVLSVFADYKGYNKIFSEVVLYLDEGIAGTCDDLFIVSSKKDSPFDLEDFKTNLDKGIEFAPADNVKEKWCLYPIDHLPNCSYTKYVLQLSMYAYMAERITGRKCRKLTLRFIPPEDKLQHIKIPVPYMKREIEDLVAEYLNMKEREEKDNLLLSQGAEEEVIFDL